MAGVRIVVRSTSRSNQQLHQVSFMLSSLGASNEGLFNLMSPIQRCSNFLSKQWVLGCRGAITRVLHGRTQLDTVRLLARHH